MIVVEDKLRQIFSYLPSMKYKESSIDTYKPIFSFGPKLELNNFLKESENKNFSPYPLIWLLYPYSENHSKKNVELKSLAFILAVNTKSDFSYPERIETTFKKILFPLYDNILSLFNKANNVNKDEVIELIKFPNYSDDRQTGDANFASVRWDALKVVFNLKLNDACLKIGNIQTNSNYPSYSNLSVSGLKEAIDKISVLENLKPIIIQKSVVLAELVTVEMPVLNLNKIGIITQIDSSDDDKVYYPNFNLAADGRSASFYSVLTDLSNKIVVWPIEP